MHGREKDLMVLHRNVLTAKFLPSGKVCFSNGEIILPIKVSSLEDKMETMLSTCYLIIDIVSIKWNKKESSKIPGMQSMLKKVGLFMFQTAKNS